jgi:hypothetical protein
MAKITKFVLPIKVGNTIQNQEFDVPGTSTPENLGFGYGTCSTAYITSAKTATITDFELTKNGIVSITFTNAVASNATLNVNSTGAKPLYHKGAALQNNIILAGDTVTFIYDGSHFNLIAIDRIPTVSGSTVIM